MISEVKKHHKKTFMVLNWESSNEKFLVPSKRCQNKQTAVPFSCKLSSGFYCIERGNY